MLNRIKVLSGTLIVLWAITTCYAESKSTTIVEISLGPVKGKHLESRSGDKFWGFLGIPYAEPPVGELRFQNPQPVKAWKPDIYDATKDGPICPQPTKQAANISEDCLRINVYTKNIKDRKPVIVLLHPGGFYALSAISTWAGPENFMDRDIVLVTLNYRLGSLGFLATGTEDAAGNMGLKDQVIALRWIQQHIEKFGGDPNSVTIWGYSAGSFSVGLHMLSSMTKGLFHKAIMMSASPLGQFKYTTHQLDLAEKQARLLGCPEKPIKDMIKCLKTKPVMEFVKSAPAMFEIGMNPVLNWRPVIESDCVKDNERYLTEDPYTSITKGHIHKVPLIMGINEYEFYYMGYNTLRNDTERKNLNEDFAKYAPIYFLYERDTPKSMEISKAFRSFYFHNKTLEFPKSLKAFGEFYADGLIGFQYSRYLDLISKHTQVYTYHFTYKGRYSFFVDPDTKQTLGPMHLDELFYLLNLSVLAPQFKKSDPENDTIERLTRFWYEFAKKSDPNNESDDYLKVVKWPLYSEDKKEYLEIGENLNVKSNGIFPERFKLWDHQFPTSELLNPNAAQCKYKKRCSFKTMIKVFNVDLRRRVFVRKFIKKNIMKIIKISCGITIAFCLAAICNADQKPTITAETSLGHVKGTQMTSRLGENFWAFLGIRYAEPPVGELRFQNPLPVKDWKPDTYDATKDGPICPQVTANLSYLSEDCLRLNIYTKDLKGRKPVIVYLYPGGFYFGGAISLYAGPENFMDRDIVLVTLNYRLGALGFLATGTAEASGNMGLKDQVMALRWIQQHIENFGGDPNSVTLWGYSAGSFSSGLHMLSPMAKGLFHKAIMMSASPLGQFKYTTHQLDLAEKQARLLKCPDKPIKEMVKCLKTKPMIDFVNTTQAMFEVGWNPVLNWRPVIENDCGGNYERYLVEDPYTTMSKGNIHKVPLVTGMNEYEFYYMGYYALRNATVRQYFNDNFAKYAPIYFLYERDTPKSLEISKAFRSFYLQNKPLEFPQSLTSFGELYADGVIGFEYYRFLQMVSKHTQVYTYLFKYKGRYSHFVNPDTNQTFGAVHHDELLYLLNLPLLTPQFKKSDPENDTVERLTRFLFEFAKKSDPNNASDDYLKCVKWPLYSESKKEYLEIGENLDVKSNGIFQERFQLWDRLFPIPEMLNTKTEQCKV
ncbi:uncharacterized protein ACRADG_012798 [Cochliomyia hominivorax]